jgi:hypothetical protein
MVLGPLRLDQGMTYMTNCQLSRHDLNFKAVRTTPDLNLNIYQGISNSQKSDSLFAAWSTARHGLLRALHVQ